MKKLLISPVLMIFISLAVLIWSTLTEAECQRKAMKFQIEEENSLLVQIARIQELDFMKSAVKLGMIKFQTDAGGNINAVAMIFDENAQLLTAETAGNNKRCIERLQIPLLEAIKNDDAFCYFMISSGSNSIFRIEYYRTYRMKADGQFSNGNGVLTYSADENGESKQFHVFAAEAFPLLTAMRKLLPIYILVGLLLISLVTIRKMVTVNREHTEEDADVVVTKENWFDSFEVVGTEVRFHCCLTLHNNSSEDVRFHLSAASPENVGKLIKEEILIALDENQNVREFQIAANETIHFDDVCFVAEFVGTAQKANRLLPDIQIEILFEGTDE